MFIKAPGQTEGEIRDDPAQTIDVMPSIADLLDARTDWEFDGHSLYDGSAAHTDPKVSEDVEAIFDVAERRAQWFPNGDDWIGLAAVGDNGDLVGTEVDDHERGEPSSYRVRLDRPDVLERLPWSDGRMPYVLAGTISSDGGDEPPELLVAVNGRLAGVAGGYRARRRRLGVHRLRSRLLPAGRERRGAVRGGARGCRRLDRQRHVAPSGRLTHRR